MKVESHPRVQTPPGDRTIWRYIDLSQLLSLLSRRSLFFSRADNFDDKNEGALPKKTRERRDEMLDGLPDKITQEFLPIITRGFTQYTYVNCWHLKETESAAMWGWTSSEDVGVCIESTVGRLKDAINRGSSEADDGVYIHEITYEDYETFDIPNWDPVNISGYLPPDLYKREQYAEQNELRAIIQRQPRMAVKQTCDGLEGYVGDDQEQIGIESDNPKGGIPVPVNFGILCAKIHVDESVPSWKVGVIRDVVEDYLAEVDYSIPVEQSDIHEATPRF